MPSLALEMKSPTSHDHDAYIMFQCTNLGEVVEASSHAFLTVNRRPQRVIVIEIMDDE